ncbi:hypothetical protein EON62_03010 [archaeon]|nr:MAG: hypothetical protein EON62_03010 [archaeon]
MCARGWAWPQCAATEMASVVNHAAHEEEARDGAGGKRSGCARGKRYFCTPSLTPHRRTVSLYWPEKLLLLLQYGQLFGLLWAFARPWPFPYLFRNRTRYVPLLRRVVSARAPLRTRVCSHTACAGWHPSLLLRAGGQRGSMWTSPPR